ncbi:MAG TPA: DUF3127 domain-containing protein [Bacteroidia bacterium]|nr:DUF3127 domain-containing protein [Bacteroidia bacterium]
MEVIGTLKVKFDTQRVSDRFQKREFVLTTEANTPYPQHVSFQVTQDKCGLLDNYREGDELRIQFNLRGREWNGPQGVKYFNTLEAWRLEKVQSGAQSQAAPASPRQGNENPVSAPAYNSEINDNDDLPF